MRQVVYCAASVVASSFLGVSGEAQIVAGHQKISETSGGFGSDLEVGAFIGDALGVLGDLDGDGVVDLVAGARGSDGGGINRGSLWILFMNADGTVKAEQEIGDGVGGLTEMLGNNDNFSSDVTGIGDVDGDMVLDLAVGSWRDDDGGLDRGAVYILFLNADGSVKAEQKISSTVGGFGGTLLDSDRFGAAVRSLGDRDGDGVPDLAVGANQDDDGGTNRGAVWILYLNADGTVKNELKISDLAGGFGGVLEDGVQFGGALVDLPDLDGDGVDDLAVGSRRDGDGGGSSGAVWILFLNADETVKAEQKISALHGGFTGTITGTRFGSAVASLGDVNGDGTGDLAVGAEIDADGGSPRGAAWILYMNTDGTVRRDFKISDLRGGFEGGIDSQDFFGVAATSYGDMNGDGVPDVVVGASGDDDGSTTAGALWVLYLGTERLRRADGSGLPEIQRVR